MAKRNLSQWPKNAVKSLNNAGAFFGVAGILTGVVGAVAAAPIVIAAGVGTVVVSLGYAAYVSFPEKQVDPQSNVGKKISLKDLQNLSENVLTFGIFGAASSGKSTFLEHSITSNQNVPVTHDTYATIVSLQTTPPRVIALVDGDGKAFSQQFSVVKNSNALFVFLDHNDGNTDKTILDSRVNVHNEYLNQLNNYLRDESLPKFELIHFILNKRDLWELSQDKQNLIGWFNRIETEWRAKNYAKRITTSFHSNNLASDINTLMNTIKSIN